MGVATKGTGFFLLNTFKTDSSTLHSPRKDRTVHCAAGNAKVFPLYLNKVVTVLKEHTESFPGLGLLDI